MTAVTQSPRAEPKAPSLKCLSSKQVSRLFGNDERAQTMLLQLDMGAFVDGQGVVHIGLVESDVHDHDRWFFTIHPPASGTLEGWWARESKDDCCQPERYTKLVPGQSTALQMLSFYQQLMQQLRARRLHGELSAVDSSEAMAALALLRSTDVNDLVGVDYSASLREIHDLVHHFDSFVRRNPDHAGMLRQHLLSLYGLRDPYR